MEPLIIPAVLSKTREDLLNKVSLTMPHVSAIQIDVMDGEFVPNKTIGIDEIKDLPPFSYEFHWMVKDPSFWIKRSKRKGIHIIHVETLSENSYLEVMEAVDSVGGRMGLAINPSTDLGLLWKFSSLTKVDFFLVMTVEPGFSGQKYIHEMNHRIKEVREKFPEVDVEVDGGVNKETIKSAAENGANRLAAASAIFKAPDVENAIKELKLLALEGWELWEKEKR